MNKFIFVSFALVMAALTISSCDRERTGSSIEPESALPPSDEIPEKLISVSEAVDYYNNFYESRVLSRAGKSSSETRKVWFSFALLEDFFAKVERVSQEKGIEITKLTFILGSDADGERTVMMAPATYDPGLGINRTFTIEDDEIIFLHAYPGDKHSNLPESSLSAQNFSNSLVLGSQGYLASKDVITMYNRYYDLEVGPYTDKIEWDTRLVYYFPGEFEGYLSYLKQNDISNDEIEISGINAIYAAYDNDPAEGIYANHVTLFFTPTDASTGNEISFSGFNLENTFSFDYTKETFKLDKSLTISNNGSGGSSTYNKGGAGPPPPPDF
ncbi:MAG: hypothetical protein AAFU57_09265 [Bacteroidota bacterium]